MTTNASPAKVRLTDGLGLYPKRDHVALGQHYTRHVDAMTREGLHAKSRIAGELAARDSEIERLQAMVAEMHDAELALADSYAPMSAEIERLRALLLRQYKADAACYAMPFDCTEAEHIAALSEHDEVHSLLAAEFKA